ncbi:MAG: hypothetical protein F4003_01570 [Acidimicrobiaceae bacterium]|nr:hypothetical protein [Acidimicrobiaceae bacterium]MYC41341.1 hypothetical protein [Acidimicrobiaceae bacterium]
MGFKEDADFARFVSVGAVGTAAVADCLSAKFAHRPIELERYAMANKVWQTKIKRLRLPDLLCVRCGLRVESRAKSKLKIMLSHSNVPGRQWDAGGMRDKDLFAFLLADIDQDPPRCGPVIFFSTEALRSSVANAKRSDPKAASEGSEVTLTWPCWVPTKRGRFVEVDDEGRIVFKGADGRVQRYWQWKKWTDQKSVYSKPGEHFQGGDKVLAGVVEHEPSPMCPGDSWDLVAALNSSDDVEKYSAVKAVGALGHRGHTDVLNRVSEDGLVDWRIRLEARVSLARLQPDHWVSKIMKEITDPTTGVDQQMETVLAISELSHDAAADALAEVAAQSSLPSELRAAAAWGLGQGASKRPELLLDRFVDPESLVSLHAISAVDEMSSELLSKLVAWLAAGDAIRAPAAAQLLQRHRCVGALLDAAETDGNSRLLALRALGELPPALVRSLAGSRLSPDIEDALLPMWLGQEDWLRQDGKEGLDALDVQKLRFH